MFDNLEDVPPIPDVSLPLDGIVDLLLNLDCKKATSYEKIPNTFLRRYAESLTMLLLFLKNLFQQDYCLMTGRLLKLYLF